MQRRTPNQPPWDPRARTRKGAAAPASRPRCGRGRGSSRVSDAPIPAGLFGAARSLNSKMKELVCDDNQTKHIAKVEFGVLTSEEMRRLSHVEVRRLLWRAAPQHGPALSTDAWAARALSARRGPAPRAPTARWRPAPPPVPGAGVKVVWRARGIRAPGPCERGHDALAVRDGEAGRACLVLCCDLWHVLRPILTPAHTQPRWSTWARSRRAPCKRR